MAFQALLMQHCTELSLPGSLQTTWAKTPGIWELQMENSSGSNPLPFVAPAGGGFLEEAEWQVGIPAQHVTPGLSPHRFRRLWGCQNKDSRLLSWNLQFSEPSAIPLQVSALQRSESNLLPFDKCSQKKKFIWNMRGCAWYTPGKLGNGNYQNSKLAQLILVLWLYLREIKTISPFKRNKNPRFFCQLEVDNLRYF